MNEDSTWEGWTSSAPQGRKVENPDAPPDYVGSIRTHQLATTERVELARKRLTEIPEAELDLTEYEVVKGFTDLFDPAFTGATHFTVIDGSLVPLRPRGAEYGDHKTIVMGDVGGGRAT